MTTQAQKEEHKRKAILQGYRKLKAENNHKAMLMMDIKYPHLAEEFDKILFNKEGE